MSTTQTRKPFRLFETLADERSTTKEFWRKRTPQERMEYLEHVRKLEFGQEAINAPTVRCYGRRKLHGEPDPKKVVYF